MVVYIKKRILIYISILLAASLAVSFTSAAAAPPAESPEAVYTGISDGSAILSNLDYSDIRNSSEDDRKMVYETGALGLVKGYGAKTFGSSRILSREELITDIYRAVGRETEGQLEAEAINAKRPKDKRKLDIESIWADGFLTLAANDGLISKQDLADALSDKQASLPAGSFHRDAPAQRQELASWLAKALGLEPVYDQNKIYSNFLDWKNTDPAMIPYIEAILRSNIMAGDGKGRFYPDSPVTLGQLVQAVKNAESSIFPLLSFDRKTGTIENITASTDLSMGRQLARVTIYIRNSGGGLHLVELSAPANTAGLSADVKDIKDLVVYKDGALGTGRLLKTGDRLEYITDSDNTVRYADVLSSTLDTQYIAAQLTSIDTKSMKINADTLFKLDYPDLGPGGKSIDFGMGDKKVNVTYNYSKSVPVTIDGKKTDIVRLKPGMNLILTVHNGIVTEISTFEFEKDGEYGAVKGIAEENNPSMGYITLYNEDGTGTADGIEELARLRTYNYVTQEDIEVYKDHREADVNDIEAGDTVFLKIDGNNNVVSVSAVSNYTPKYGRVISRKGSTLAVEYDGKVQTLNIDAGTLVISNGRASGYSSIKDGDQVRLLLQITPKSTKIKEITIEGSKHFITNIYKGTFSNINNTSKVLLAQNLMVLNNGSWVRTNQKGFTGIRLAEGYRLYYNDRAVTLGNTNKYFKGNEAYIAVEKDYGGEEQAVLVTFMNNEDGEDVPYDDSVSSAVPGAGEFTLSKKTEKIKYGEGTIVVKDGRLVSGNSISGEDAAYVVARRKSDSGDYYAGVVQIGERSDINLIQIYRGRIRQINEEKDFTVESYSQLNGTAWVYSNTPKVFGISFNTRIVSDSGVINQWGFMDYGNNSFKNTPVYVITRGTETLLVSTAPYGTSSIKGRIYEITGAAAAQGDTAAQEPNGFKLAEVKTYDTATYKWVDSNEMTLSILKNSIIYRNNSLAGPSDLAEGDIVRIIKKDNTATGDAYIIVVEN